MDPSLRHARVDLFLPRGVTCGSVFLRLSFPFPSRFRVDLFVSTKVAIHPSSRRSSRHDPLVSPNDVSLVPCHPPNDAPPLWQWEPPTCPSKGPGEFLLQLGGFGGGADPPRRRNSSEGRVGWRVAPVRRTTRVDAIANEGESESKRHVPSPEKNTERWRKRTCVVEQTRDEGNGTWPRIQGKIARKKGRSRVRDA